MFKQNFVLAVKVNGKILREIDDIAYLPFGTEYTILLKNTSTLRAKAKISIDGSDVTDGIELVVDANESVELKRFVRNGNLDAGNAFKFIEKTSQIVNHRGSKAEDGLITVVYEFEKQTVAVPNYVPYYVPTPYKGSPTYPSWWLYNGHNGACGVYSVSNTLGGGILTSNTASGDAVSYAAAVPRGVVTAYNLTTSDSFSSVDTSIEAASEPKNVLRSKSKSVNTDGITAPGSHVEQKLTYVSGFATDGIKHSMTLMLKGKEKETVVVAPVVVKKSVRCTMCGSQAKQTAKFCSQCGASVQLI